MPGDMKPDQSRCVYLAFRCFTGYDRRDKEKTNRIPAEKAFDEWKELLEKRFPQPASGGRPFVLKIAQVVKDKKTQEGLDVTERNLSSAARAYHEENKEDHARTRGTVEKAARDVLDARHGGESCEGCAWTRIDAHGHAWTRMDTHGHAWTRMDTNGHASARMDAHGHAWTRMDTHRHAWTRMDTHGHAWTRMDAHGRAWTRMDTYGHAATRMDAHGHAWTRMDAHRRAWTRMDAHGRA